MRCLISIALAIAMTALSAEAKPSLKRQMPEWLQSWGASPAPSYPSTTINPYSLAPSFENQTLIQVMRLSAGGARLRVRISNEYGTSPLSIGAARITVLGPGGEPSNDTGKLLTFSGRTFTTIPAGAPLLSDAVELPTRPFAEVQVAVFLPEAVHSCTCHTTGGQHILISPPGNYTDQPFVAPARSATYRAFVTGIEVETVPVPVIVTFGDSITDGFGSTNDTNARWPDRLAERLLATSGAQQGAVVNAGLSGNRILADGRLVFMGQSALTRFDRDVLAVPGASHLIVLEGVNDLGVGAGKPPSTADLMAGLRQIIQRAHAHGLKVIGGTITPYEGAAYFHEEGEAVRSEVNSWIRTSAEFDGVVDFDAAVRDPTRPTKFRAELQSGDWLHPNNAGYRAMGDAIDLKLFFAKEQ